MIGIKILAVGSLKEKYWRDAFAEYQKRLGAYCKFSMVEVKEAPDDDIDKEGELLLKKIEEGDYVITLEIQGLMRSSTELAKRMQTMALGGKSRHVFVIGGSNGLSPKVCQRADETLSFSKMTFPHQLMRVILAEQIYRGFKINRGESYHK